MKDSTETLIMAAHEQFLSTRATETRIYQIRQDLRCRLCRTAPVSEASETIQHIIAGCKMLAGAEYMEGYNQVASVGYSNICTKFGRETQRSKWDTPPNVVENVPN